VGPVVVELEVATANAAATPTATMATMVDPTPAPPAEAPTPCEAPPAAPTVTPTAWATCMDPGGSLRKTVDCENERDHKTGKVFFNLCSFFLGSKNRTPPIKTRFRPLRQAGAIFFDGPRAPGRATAPSGKKSSRDRDQAAPRAPSGLGEESRQAALGGGEVRAPAMRDAPNSATTRAKKLSGVALPARDSRTLCVLT